MEDSEEDYFCEMTSCVMVKGEWIPVDDTEFLNIEEDLQGYDLMTFKYKGNNYRSRVTQRPQQDKVEV